jgi:hypothetical protein
MHRFNNYYTQVAFVKANSAANSDLQAEAKALGNPSSHLLRAPLI